MKEIGLAYDRIRWEEKALIKASKKANLNLKLVDCKKVCIDLGKEDKIKETFGNLVLQRCISHYRGLHITSILESVGLEVINKFQVSLICGDKLLTTLALIKQGIPVPKTAIAFHPETALEAIKVVGYPAVMKPVIGSWGRLVSLVKDEETARSLIETREAIGSSLLKIYYLQEFVKRPQRDIRVIVIGGEVIAASYRYPPHGDWRTNVARGGVSKPCPLTPELEEISLKAYEAVGGGVLAIDCMESPEGLVVNEVNNNIEFRGLSSATGVDVAEKIIEYAVEVMKK